MGVCVGGHFQDGRYLRSTIMLQHVTKQTVCPRHAFDEAAGAINPVYRWRRRTRTLMRIAASLSASVASEAIIGARVVETGGAGR